MALADRRITLRYPPLFFPSFIALFSSKPVVEGLYLSIDDLERHLFGVLLHMSVLVIINLD